MKARWFWFCICVVAGLVLLGCGLLVPVHLRAVDSSVVLSAGRTGESLLERGKMLADAGKLGSAEMYVAAAHTAEIPGWDRLGDTITNQATQHPGAIFWGDDTGAKNLFGSQPSQPDSDFFAGFIVQRANREAALRHLGSSGSPVVQELLKCRELAHLEIFPPSSSPSGQAFDAVVAECGLLVEGNHLTTELSSQIQQLAAQANNRGGGSQPLEEVLMDLGSLGERLNWDQLTALVVNAMDVNALHDLSAQVSMSGERLPVVFVAVQLSGQPAAVTEYLGKYPKTGMQDISASLWYGGNGVKELAQSSQRFYRSDVMGWFAARNPFGGLYYFAAARSLQDPWLVLVAKWLCYLAAGFCFAAAWHALQPPVSDLERQLHVRGFHLLREFLFSLGFLLVVLLLSEPFLAQEDQVGGVSFRLRLPMAGGAVPADITAIKHTIMNPTILITLLVFFVLQALLYISCLVKLAEIRRQQIPPRMKLKLLENEDHLFDAGLYLGFVGTIVSLIIASLGMVKFSLMAAYSSTSFGIIFVVIFKIFHLRPARRKLLLEAELAGATHTGPGGSGGVVVVTPPPAAARGAVPEPV